jgi:hypothetical protein
MNKKNLFVYVAMTVVDAILSGRRKTGPAVRQDGMTIALA